MNADDLRSIQAPLKDLYRQSPDAALGGLVRVGFLVHGDLTASQADYHAPPPT